MTSAADAVALIRSGMNVFVQSAAATPTPLLEALAARTDLEDVKLHHLHMEGPAPFAEPGCAGRFRSISFFAGPNVRRAIEEGRADFIPIFLSDIPALFTSGHIRLDAALLQLSPCDRQGFCSLGTSVDAARAAADTAPLLIAEINAQMPRTHGLSHVQASRITTSVHTDRPLWEHTPDPENAVTGRIGEIVAGL